MEIERVSVETASVASHIYALSWKTGYKKIVPQPYLDQLSLEGWTSRLKQSIYTDFLLKDHNKYVAVMSVSPARDEHMRGWGEIVSLYVLPEYFRNGYGRILFSHGVECLHKHGFQKIYLWVLEKNDRARSFYHSMGFIFNGDRNLLNIGGKELTAIRYVNQLEPKCGDKCF